MIGQKLGRYRLIEKIGAGGMGVVYRARDEQLERDVALKVLPAGALADDEARKRFRREALALSRLNHPNIATVYDFASEENVDFMAMEYIAGVTLEQKSRSGAWPEPDVLKVGKQAAEALEAAHEQGLVHRDLKPGNIMMTPKGLVKVLDFGLAMLLRPQGPLEKTMTLDGSLSLAGTLPYMAPEQIQGGEVDERTDIHALGAVLFELATAKRPFPEETPTQVMQAILQGEPAAPRSLNPRISQGLEGIILKCLEKEPGDRYASAKELLADLNRLEAGDPTALVAGKPGRRSGRSRWRKPLAVGLSALGVGGLLFVLNLGGMRNALTGRSRAPQVHSLAVLPLDNLSHDPEQEYFAEGITDALITELGQVSALRVTSRTSTRQYKNSDKSLPQIARELKANLVVEGSVLKAGEKVRIAAKLISPAGDKPLWVKSYERDLADYLALQSEIARDITRQIGIRLGEERRFDLAKRKPVNPQALDAYLKGVYAGDNGHFQQAVKLDPDFALAYVRLAESHYFSGLFGDARPREAFLKTKEAALKALEKDRTLGEAHGYLALALLHYDLDWAGAEREFKRAIELNPSLSMVRHLYAHYLMAVDKMDESLAESKLALELDPFTSDMTSCIGWHCLTTAEYDDAIQYARRGLAMDPQSSLAMIYLGWAYEQKSMLHEAIAEFKNALALWENGSLPLSALAHACGISGRTKEARDILGKLLGMSERAYIPAYDIAVVHMGLGDKDQALEWLNKAFEERSGFLVYIKCDRRFDPLYSDPRWEELLKRIGLSTHRSVARKPEGDPGSRRGVLGRIPF